MTSCCVRYSNWFINQMVELSFWSFGFMLSPLLEDQKKKKKQTQLVVSSSKSQKPLLEYTALTPWHRAAVLWWWKPLWREKKRKIESKHLHKLFMITLIHVWYWREEGLCLGQKAKPMETDSQEFASSPQLNISLLHRWGFLPAVYSHPLSDGRPQLASCFSLTNGNFTVLHQCVHIALPAFPCARTDCLAPAAV